MPHAAEISAWAPETAVVQEDANCSERLATWTWAFVALGVAVRLIRFLLRFPLFDDEMLLVENFIDRSYADCLHPLDNRQVAPLLYLWIEVTSVKLLGFSEWSLRLFPAACGVASVFLFRQFASRLLRGLPLLLSVAIFSVSFYPIRHATEAKPYASDLAMSLLLLVLAVEWWRNPRQTMWLWTLALVAPLAIGLSFPAVFVAGGISLGLAWQAWQQGFRSRLALTVCNLAILGAFLVFTSFSSEHQFESHQAFMREYWAASFPPLAQPLKFVVWMFATHTGEMFAYPFGGERCGSLLTTACFVIGAWQFARRRQFSLLGMFAGIFALAFIAAVMRRYPYGDNARLVQFLAPPICLLAGLGGSWLIALIGCEVRRRRAMSGVALMLAICGLGITVFDLVHPYKHQVDMIHRDFAQWFWRDETSGAEIYLLPEPKSRTTESAGYSAFRCLRRIYSRQPRAIASSDRPVVYIHFHTTGDQIDETALATELVEVQSQLAFAGRREFSVHLIDSHRQAITGQYEVFQFVRGDNTNMAQVPAALQRTVR